MFHSTSIENIILISSEIRSCLYGGSFHVHPGSSSDAVFEGLQNFAVLFIALHSGHRQLLSLLASQLF